MAVLVVDDSEFHRNFVDRALNATHASDRIEIAENGNIARQLIDEGLSPDVILLDVIHPGAKGKAFLASLQSTDLPIVTLSDTNAIAGYNEAGKRVVSDWQKRLMN